MKPRIDNLSPHEKKLKQQEFQTKLNVLKEFAFKQQKQETQNAMDMTEQLVSTYPDQIYECVDRAKKAFQDSPRDHFFVMSALKQEPLTPKIWKNQFMYSIECPRPYLNFTVFKYHRLTDELEMIWSIPDRETLNFYYKNRMYASPEDWVILKYVIEYKDGTLWNKMKELNKESDNKPSLIIHDRTIFN